jgi:hypothetical protein
MEFGYMYKPDGTLVPIEWCNLKLEHHGENGRPPLDYSFFFQAGEFLSYVPSVNNTLK